MTLKNSLLTCLIFFCALKLQSQIEQCGFDQFRSEKPQSLLQDANANELIREYVENHAAGLKTILSIPVVVHVVHQNGAENISDAAIINALDEANQRFQNSGSFYDAAGNDVGIRLCLASVDPAGNPTTGITRTVSPYTNFANYSPVTTDRDANLKNLIRWEPYLYLNFWVVKNIDWLAHSGYAVFPSSAGTTTDGIVLEAPSFIYSPFIVHEVGHYLGLFHTFQGNCKNFNCSLDGDMVCDTPPDGSDQPVCNLNSCSTDLDDTTGLSPFMTDVPEPPNYMDYSGCYTAFTAGQGVRMNAGLTTLRSELLQSNGCGSHPGGPIPVASFTIGGRLCDGKYVFTNTSVNGIGAQWDFNSDGIIEGSGNTISYAFPADGNYAITMYTTGYGGMDTLTLPSQYFYKAAPYQNYPLVNGFSGLVLSATPGTFEFCPGAIVGLHGEAGMVSYQWSTGQTTQNISFQPTEAFTVSLTAIDINGNSWTSCYPFTVHPVSPPELSIAGMDTTFCIGDQVTIEAVFGPNLTASSWYYNQAVIPGVTGTTYSLILVDTNAIYLSQTQNTGCTTLSDTLWIIVDSCSSLSLNSLVNADDLELYPNPANEKLVLTWDKANLSDAPTISLFRYDGKQVYSREMTTGLPALTIDTKECGKGAYLLVFQTTDGQKITKKVILD